MDMDIEEEYEGQYRTPSRRGTFSKLEMEPNASSIPMPSALPTPSGRRQSASGPAGRRTSTGVGRPGTSGGRKLSDLGETY